MSFETNTNVIISRAHGKSGTRNGHENNALLPKLLNEVIFAKEEIRPRNNTKKRETYGRLFRDFSCLFVVRVS